tara:strand:- start:70 stop:3396 length:3327 start_codon:yes stop_codon:yes gene_type:complete
MFTFPFTMMSSADDAYSPAAALWFDGGADYLIRDPASSGNRRTFTFSCWLKRSAIGSAGGTTGNNIFGADRTSSYSDRFMFGTADDGNDWLEFSCNDGSSGACRTSALYRDPTAWMHVLWVIDTTQSTDTDRVKLYVNGSIVAFNSPSYPTQNFDTYINYTENQTIGVRPGTLTQQHYGGYMADVILLDGTAVSDASDFGETDSDTGIWVPKDPSGLTFGTNGFWLDFADGGYPGLDVHSSATGNADFGVKHLMHFDGSDAATSATDSGLSAASITFTGNAQLDTSVKKFGTASLLLDGSGDEVSFTCPVFGTDNYTIDFWIYPLSSTHDNAAIMGNRAGTGDDCLIIYFKSGSNNRVVMDTPMTEVHLGSSSTELSINTWYHVAFTYDGVTNRQFINGTLIDTTATSFNLNRTETWRIGQDNSGNKPNDLNGHIDELRIVHGVCKWTTSFTPETSAYSNPTKNNSFIPSSMSAANVIAGENPVNDADNNKGNYCTWNPVANGGDVTLSEGNRVMTAPNPNDNNFVYGTHAMRTGKWYMEFGFIRAVDFNDSGVYLVDQTFDFGSDGPHTTASNNQWGITLESNTELDLRHNNSRTSNSVYTIPTWVHSADRLLMAFDADNKKVWFGYYDASASQSKWLENDGTVETSQSPPTAAPSFATTGVVSGEEFSGEGWYLCGHFNDNNNTGNKMRMYAQESEWVGTAPSGFKALATHNYAEPTITKPSNHYNAVEYTLSGSAAQTISPGFGPDLVIIKRRSGGGQHWSVLDSVRGTGYLSWNDDGDEGWDGGTSPINAVTDWGPSSLSLQSGGKFATDSAGDYIAYCWEAGGRPTATNSVGVSDGATMTSGSVFKGGSAHSFTPHNDATIFPEKMSIADHYGFSIVHYEGNATAGAKVPHGLDAAPDMIIMKNFSDNGPGWYVYHTSMGTSHYVRLEVNSGYTSESNYVWNGTAPDDNLFTLGGGSSYVNDSGKDHIAYCFKRTPGLIGIGSYIGNESTNGPPIIVDDGASGFRPAFILEKRLNDSSGSAADGAWYVIDAERVKYNPVNLSFLADSTNADVTGTASSGAFLDITSNGYKIRGTSSGQEYNRSGTYIYLAFAESAFGLNNRAR